MAFDKGLVEWTREALEPVGVVTMRPMMGVAMLYCDGVVFAVADESALWFKGDAESDAVWDAAGCERFTFVAKDGTAQSLNYRSAPADVYDDADAMCEWAGVAIAAGLRRPQKPRSRRAR